MANYVGISIDKFLIVYHCQPSPAYTLSLLGHAGWLYHWWGGKTSPISVLGWSIREIPQSVSCSLQPAGLQSERAPPLQVTSHRPSCLQRLWIVACCSQFLMLTPRLMACQMLQPWPGDAERSADDNTEHAYCRHGTAAETAAPPAEWVLHTPSPSADELQAIFLLVISAIGFGGVNRFAGPFKVSIYHIVVSPLFFFWGMIVLSLNDSLLLLLL